MEARLVCNSLTLGTLVLAATTGTVRPLHAQESGANYRPELMNEREEVGLALSAAPTTARTKRRHRDRLIR